MNILLEVAAIEAQEIIHNLGRFYAYDMSRYCGFSPGWEMPPNGLYESNDWSTYWKEPDRYPFLIKIDNELAGFVLINKIGTTPDVDWNMGEFFIISKFQGKGIGRKVANQLFEKFPGVWEVMQLPENSGAITFWEKVIGNYTQGQMEKTKKMIAHPKPHHKQVIRFQSKK